MSIKKSSITSQRSNFRQLNAGDLLKDAHPVNFAVDNHPGLLLSSDWDYKDRQIVAETRTFFNNFLVIERTYEHANAHDEDCESCKSCETNDNRKSSKKSVKIQKNVLPDLIVHRPSFAVPNTYEFDVEEIKDMLHHEHSHRGWCKFVLIGILCMAMVLLFAIAFLGIEQMED